MSQELDKTGEALPLVDQAEFFGDEVTFFGLDSTGTPAQAAVKNEPVIKEDEEEEEAQPAPSKKAEPAGKKEKAEKAGKQEVSEESEEEEDFTFGQEAPAKAASEETETPAKGEEVTDGEFFKKLSLEMKEQGIFQLVEVKEDEPLDQDTFVEKFDQEIEARVKETIQSFLEELDEDGKRFLKFKRSGGDTRAFLQAYYSSMALPTVDLTTEDGQEAVLRYYYKNVEGLDPEDVDSRIDWAKENKKLAKYAEKYDGILQEREEARKEALLQQQAEYEAQMEKSRKDFEKDLVEVLQATDAVGDIPLTKEDKKTMPAYMLKPSIRIGKNKYITPLQADLKSVYEDKKQLLLLAKLVRSKFDLSSLGVKLASKKVEQARKNLLRDRETPEVKGGNTKTGASLADYDF